MKCNSWHICVYLSKYMSKLHCHAIFFRGYLFGIDSLLSLFKKLKLFYFTFYVAYLWLNLHYRIVYCFNFYKMKRNLVYRCIEIMYVCLRISFSLRIQLPFLMCVRSQALSDKTQILKYRSRSFIISPRILKKCTPRITTI